MNNLSKQKVNIYKHSRKNIYSLVSNMLIYYIMYSKSHGQDSFMVQLDQNIL